LVAAQNSAGFLYCRLISEGSFGGGGGGGCVAAGCDSKTAAEVAEEDRFLGIAHQDLTAKCARMRLKRLWRYRIAYTIQFLLSKHFCLKLWA
jgi:hypothetical protein